jgi:hypothetical protein
MFEFFNKNKETVTSNTSEQVTDSSIEAVGGTNAELFYKSPEYKEATEVYELVGPEDFFIDLKKELTTDAGDLYEDDEDFAVDEAEDVVDSNELITEVPIEPSVENEDIIDGDKDKTINIKNRVLSASAALSVGLLAACDKVTEYYPELDVRWGEKPAQTETVPAKPEVKDQTESTPTKQDVKPKTETTQPEKVEAVVEKTSGENVESTLPTKKGVAEVFEKYREKILPSGDPRYGYLTLNNETALAAANGGLKPFSELEVYALEVSEDPAEQGIPYKSIWILILSENKTPKPLIKGELSSYKNYISRNKNGVYHVTPEKLDAYKKNLIKGISESSFKKIPIPDKATPEQVAKFIKADRRNYIKKLEGIEKFGISELYTILEWKNASPSGRAALMEKWVKPYQNRTGTIKDKK